MFSCLFLCRYLPLIENNVELSWWQHQFSLQGIRVGGLPVQMHVCLLLEYFWSTAEVPLSLKSSQMRRAAVWCSLVTLTTLLRRFPVHQFNQGLKRDFFSTPFKFLYIPFELI